MNSQANSIVSSIKDEDHVREAFPATAKDGVTVHHISITTDIRALLAYEAKLNRNIIGNQKTLARVRLRRMELAEQMSLFDDIRAAK